MEQKKKYKAPEMQVVDIVYTKLLCGSGDSTEDSPIDETPCSNCSF